MAQKFNYVNKDNQYISSSDAYFTKDGKHIKVLSAYLTVNGQHIQVFSSAAAYALSCNFTNDSTFGDAYAKSIRIWEYTPDGEEVTQGMDWQGYTPDNTIEISCEEGVADIADYAVEWRLYNEAQTSYEVIAENRFDASFTMPSYDVKVAVKVTYSGSGTDDKEYYDITYGSSNNSGHIFTNTPHTSGYYGEEIDFEADGVTEGEDFEIIGRVSQNSYGSPTAMAGGAYFLFTMPDESVDVIYTKI